MTNAIVSYDEKWAAFAQQFSNQVPVSAGKSLSLKGGVFSLGDEQIGTLLCAIIVDSVAINTYFEGEYAEGKKDVPKCYAYGFPPEEMRPHVESMQKHMDVFYPQTLDPATGNIGPCSSCRWNEYGSASRGAGKACQNKDRLALLPAGHFVQRKGGFGYDLQLIDDPNHFATADIVKLSLPVTSVKNYRAYAQQVIQQTRRPPWGVISVLELAPHPKFQIEVKFHTQELIPDSLFNVIRDRYTATHATMIEPFSPPQAGEQQPAQAPRPTYQPPATAMGLTGGFRR